MSQPTVCCVLLVNGREAMVRRAIASFRAQTYEKKKLVIWDTGDKPALSLGEWDPEMWYAREPAFNTIGALRNEANSVATQFGADLIAHFDSDDVSHPLRLEEQVALLEASGKLMVGYNELLFWDTRYCDGCGKPLRECRCVPNQGASWLYSNPNASWCCDASRLYRRELWERNPFPDAPHGDQRWWAEHPEVHQNTLGVSALTVPVCERESIETGESPMYQTFRPGELRVRSGSQHCDPRLVCEIHGSNMEAYKREVMLRGGQVWKRAPEFDQHCAERMRLL